MRPSRHLLALAAALGAATAPTAAQDDATFVRDDVLGALTWRSLGPANFSGRIIDIEVDPRDRFTFYVVSATGGLHKTTNNGVNFSDVFHSDDVFSLGDLAIAPSNPDVLYLGTGEANNQRSSYWGNGVHKSTDGGATWEHVGLDGTDHIGRVVVHPTNPDVVYVAALGALYRPNRERGLYRSTDGGSSWQCVKWIDEDVGFVDVALHHGDPDTLLAAAYDRRRRAWNFRDEGPGSRLWRSTDAGESWEKVEGLPGGAIGRIGVAFHPEQHDLAYTIVENGNPREDRRNATIGGEVYRSTDAGETWEKVSEERAGGSPHYYYGQIRLDPGDPDHLWALGVRVYESHDGGKTWDTGYGRRLHVDHHALWIDPVDPRRALLGNDGGLGETRDGGQTWTYYENLPLAQFYAVGVDLRQPYNVYGGTQDNGTWGIPSRPTAGTRLDNSDAFKIGGGDGFQVQVDPTDPDVLYGESQFGALYRVHLDTGSRRGIRPRSRRGEPDLRFNWMSPLELSPHNPHTLYFGSQFVHRSRDRGDSWQRISPDLTTNDPDKLRGDVPHCTVTCIVESPRQAGLLFAGTDDGRVWRSHDDGGHWTELTDRCRGVPRGLWVSRIEASPQEADRVYVAFTGYREDLRDPFLFLSTDRGESFRSIVNDLPGDESINVVREHPRNADCVLVGTEFGAYVSLDGGGRWHALGSDLPTCAVHDLVVHPRAEDVIVATHGRGFWLLEAAPLAELNDAVLGSALHVFQPRDGHRVGREFSTVRYPGERGWRSDAIDTTARFEYYLAQPSAEQITLAVYDAAGERAFRARGNDEAGLHRVDWQERRRRGSGGAARPGAYLLQVSRGDEVVAERTFRVHAAPQRQPTTVGEESVTGERVERDV